MDKKIEQTIQKEKKNIVAITKQANKIELIKTNDDLVKATEFLVLLKNKLDSLENERLEYSKPLNAVLKKINSGFKELTTPLKETQNTVKDLIREYRERKEEERLKAEKLLQSSGKNTDLIVESTIPDVIESQSGEIRTVRRWTFDIIDETKIPREYFCIDSEKIQAAIIKDGVRDIPGLKIYQKETTSVYSK
jgi:hypothetical protein